MRLHPIRTSSAAATPVPSATVFAAIVLAGMTLAGCTSLRTPYRPPQVTLAPAWPHGGAAAAPAAAGPWWTNFGDARLDALVARALARNNNLAAAAVAVKRARIQARLAVINPTVTGTVDLTDTRPLSGHLPDAQLDTTSLSVAYEVDLFGALAATRDVAVWEARATQQDLESARLTLIGTTVDLYYQTAYLNEQIALARQSIAYAEKTLALVKALRGAGSASALDIAQADQQLTSQQANLHALLDQQVAARNSIALLLNGEAEDPADELQVLPDAPLPAVDAGLPASLLARRPDLRAAELRLREQLAQVDQTRLSFYPVLTLTGSVGTTSVALLDLLRNPAGVLGAGAALPFLQANQMKLEIAGAKLDYEKAVINFRQTLYQALADVDNALSTRTQDAAEAALLETSLADARLAERLYEVRYRAGSVALKSWLDEQETRRQAEVALAQNQFNRIQNHVTLYEALGGDAAP